MPFIYNPTLEDVTTKMQGNWFTFKPGSRKRMDEDKARWINEFRKEEGLVVLPSQFETEDGSFNEEFAKTPEGSALLEAKRQEGIASLIEFHKNIIKNNQISLRKDMAKANPVGDTNRMVALEMSKGEQRSLALVAKYQREKNDVQDTRLKEIEKLLEQAGPLGD